QINAVIEAAPENFLVFSGNDGDTLTVLSLGGYGVVSVSAHLVGRQTKQMIEAAIGGDMAKAAKMHHHLLPLVNALFMTTSPMPLKAAMNELGFNVGKPRLPLVELSEAEKAKLRAVLANYEFDAYLSHGAGAAKQTVAV
ncbi:MAG: dihydrodipicolinate synthase family protein, partial [Chloroflexota bacterium]|nr:dihydrodipicolinate synthase family protein [Chloroflexota bacterium]